MIRQFKPGHHPHTSMSREPASFFIALLLSLITNMSIPGRLVDGCMAKDILEQPEVLPTPEEHTFLGIVDRRFPFGEVSLNRRVRQRFVFVFFQYFKT
jgi:hypothetical protein